MESAGLQAQTRNRRSALAPSRRSERWFHPHLELLEYRCLLSITPSTVVGRFTFYDNSFYDGNVSGASSSDDNAIASDKSALISGSGQATFANVTGYSKGINGVMVDISGSHPGITASDFTFKVGNNNVPSSWAAAPAPTTVSVRGGAVSGADRVELLWADNAIRKEWLEVIVAADRNTGLGTSDVFFFGNEVGDTGLNDPSVAKADSFDVAGIQAHGANNAANIPDTNVFDIDKNHKVDSNDVSFAQANGTNNATGLQFLNPPSISPPALSAALANDTGTNSDGITTDPTIAGTLTGVNGITSFKAGLNAGPVTTDALPLVQGNGTFTLSSSFLATANGGSLPDGAYVLHLQAIDSQGLSAALDLAFTLKRSIATPALPDLTDASDSGASNTDNITNINTPTIAVTAETGSLVKLLVDNVQVAQNTANPGLQFTLATLADGTHQIQVNSSDGAGNSANSPTLSITISTSLPTVSAKTLATFTDDLTSHVTVTASDQLALANGTQVNLDVDLNNNSSFGDSGEQNYTLSTLFGGTTTFQMTPALPATAPGGGTYTVGLRARVTDIAGNQGVSAVESLKIDTLSNNILQNYLNNGDTSSNATHLPTPTTFPGSGYTLYVYDLISQTWRTTADVDKPVWHHWLQVVVPSFSVQNPLSPTALLLIDGGNNTSAAPTSTNPALVQAALMFHAVTIDLPDVPSEPLIFTGDPGHSRSEDAIIAYTFNQYMTHLDANGLPTAGNQDWPALLPMVKSAVRAMDAVQSAVPAVSNFIVTGYSKRGWTTWLTAAEDPRVLAIIPGVFDDLNGDEQMMHHYGVYGFFAPTLNDYTAYNIPQNVLTSQGQELTRVVDPYRYLSNGRFNIPKLTINAAGDEFFVPDSDQFYFSDLPGTKNYVRYIPNVGHGLNTTDPVNSSLSFEDAVLNNKPLPQFSWTTPPDGSIRVQTIDTPTTVKLWQATNPNARDFRRSVTGISYTSSTLTSQGGGLYVASVPTPSSGATAFFVELTFPHTNPDGSNNPYIFTTEIKVVTNLALFAWPFGPSGGVPGAQPAGSGSDLNVVAPSLAAPVAVSQPSPTGQWSTTTAKASDAANSSGQQVDGADSIVEDWPWVEPDRTTRRDSNSSDAEATDFVLGSLTSDRFL